MKLVPEKPKKKPTWTDLEMELQTPFVVRLKKVYNKSRNFGYGVFYDMDVSLCDYGFSEEE